MGVAHIHGDDMESISTDSIIGVWWAGRPLSAKCIIVVALAVVQSLYFLVQVEGIPEQAMEKARSRVVCDMLIQTQDCCLSRILLLYFPTYPNVLDD